MPPTDSGSAVDNDGDGVPANEDCDDDDASVNPSAQGVCDGLDNTRRSGREGVLLSWYADGDGGRLRRRGAIEALRGARGATSPWPRTATTPGRHQPRRRRGPTAPSPRTATHDGSTGFADNDGDGFPACEVTATTPTAR
ncbi:MAG: putative metal-binding motif-containing protein [Deltaproteobacteria bacterium]|nr:putative metal-binding motif-containing protein [Deltaproteobacteria bacterium]